MNFLESVRAEHPNKCSFLMTTMLQSAAPNLEMLDVAVTHGIQADSADLINQLFALIQSMAQRCPAAMSLSAEIRSTQAGMLA